MDARLRPDGEQGPLACSLAGYREYYRNRAQFWERQALVKARFVAGDEDLGKQFAQMVTETVYHHPLTAAELDQMKTMRRRIETERGDQEQMELEFKTGPGGLVDVEFLVQALQLRHGHDHVNLRTSHTLAALNRLTSLGVIDEEQSSALRRNYLFFRRIESVLRRVEIWSIWASLRTAHGLNLAGSSSAHSAICRHDSARVSRPRSRIMPVSSAIGMNSAGLRSPRTGCRHRASDSKPAIRPVGSEMIG